MQNIETIGMTNVRVFLDIRISEMINEHANERTKLFAKIMRTCERIGEKIFFERTNKFCKHLCSLSTLTDTGVWVYFSRETIPHANEELF